VANRDLATWASCTRCDSLNQDGKSTFSIVRSHILSVNVCDLPSKFDELSIELQDTGMHVYKDGYAVSRRSDVVFYSVEAKNIDAVVAQYGPATKVGAIVSGQTSVKEPEVKAFEKHLPPDVHIIPCHSMHGPNVDPVGQPLVLVRHRCDDEHFELMKRLLECMKSDVVELSYLEHDRITADTQAVTHLAFLSMGTAWKTMGQFPWEDESYVGGIDNVKVLMALRIYSNKWHVYAGLAMMNPSAKEQIKQYAQSATDLFKLMIQEEKDEFISRVRRAQRNVFGQAKQPVLLSDDILAKFGLSIIPKDRRRPNSHLSLLAMADCWNRLGIHPYDHMICQTPVFRLLLGITEYLFHNEEMLENSIQAALYDKNLRVDDLEFCTAVRGWVQCIQSNDMEGYRMKFEDTAVFFEHRLTEANRVSSQLIAQIQKNINS
jgi:prephenate dehydrogenase (NADP+)